jgi:hypothetical protein
VIQELLAVHDPVPVFKEIEKDKIRLPLQHNSTISNGDNLLFDVELCQPQGKHPPPLPSYFLRFSIP